MFQLICNQTPRFTIGDCAAGHRADNRDKNRNVLIVPREYKDREECPPALTTPLSPSWQLPAVHHIIPRKQLHGLHQRCVCRCEYLTHSDIGGDCSYLQGYTHPREYIVTEWPVVSTCSDLWSLVYDHDCSAVVVLCNPSPGVSNVSPARLAEVQEHSLFFFSVLSFLLARESEVQEVRTGLHSGVCLSQSLPQHQVCGGCAALSCEHNTQT